MEVDDAIAVFAALEREDVEALTSAPLDPDNLRRVIEWSAFCRHLHPTSWTPGVHRFRTPEDAAAAREGR